MKKPKYKLYTRMMVFSGIILAATLCATSLRIITAGRSFTQTTLEENRVFLINTLRFGHGMMQHMGNQNYEDLINIALESKFVQSLTLLDKQGKVLAQKAAPGAALKSNIPDVAALLDGKIFAKTSEELLIAYRAREIEISEEHRKHHSTFPGGMQKSDRPAWFLVTLDTSLFDRHYRDMVVQTIVIGASFLLFGILLMVFFGIVQRYELASLSLEKLEKIRRLLGHFVPDSAKRVIEKDPDKKGLLDRYIQDATILFLDIEGFSRLLGKYPQEKINQTVEAFFSAFLELIQKNRGDINETAGDGMMVIFTDPEPLEHARKACRTALEIRAKLKHFPVDGVRVHFAATVNIGIHSGRVYLGSTKMRGEQGERWTYTASGAVTILAARLSQYARHGQILVGEETAKRTSNSFSLKSLQKVSLRNIGDPGVVYELEAFSK